MISFPGAADSRAYETQDGFKGAILQDMLIPSNTEGAISRILESAPWDPNVKVIQHQAASSPGSSGAPVFDECGIVAAIHNASSSSPGVRFAIRSIELIELMRRSAHTLQSM